MSETNPSGIFSRFRPGLWLFVWAHAFTGFIVAAGKQALHLDLETVLRALLAGAHWAVFVVGSACALSSVFSEPSENDPRTSHRSFAVAVAAMLAGLGLSAAFNWRYFDLYLMAIILVVAYSAPPIELGKLKIGGAAARALGLGATSFFAGYAASNLPAEQSMLTTTHLAGFIFLVLAAETAVAAGFELKTAWLFWFFLAVAFALLAVAEVRVGGKFSSIPLVVPLIGWCAVGVQFGNAGDRKKAFALRAALGLFLATDAGLAVCAILR